MDGQNRTELDDLLSIGDIARRWRCNYQTAEQKTRRLDLPMIQMGREKLARKIDVEDLERQILERKLPRGGTTEGTGHKPYDYRLPRAETANGQTRGRPPGRRRVAAP